MDLTQVKEAPHTNEPVGELEGRQYYNASYTEFPKHELKLTDSNYTRERTVAINCNSKDGVKPMSKEEQAFERQLNWELVKRFTMAIFKMDVTRFSLQQELLLDSIFTYSKRSHGIHYSVKHMLVNGLMEHECSANKHVIIHLYQICKLSHQTIIGKSMLNSISQLIPV